MEKVMEVIKEAEGECEPNSKELMGE